MTGPAFNERENYSGARGQTKGFRLGQGRETENPVACTLFWGSSFILRRLERTTCNTERPAALLAQASFGASFLAGETEREGWLGRGTDAAALLYQHLYSLYHSRLFPFLELPINTHTLSHILHTTKGGGGGGMLPGCVSHTALRPWCAEPGCRGDRREKPRTIVVSRCDAE